MREEEISVLIAVDKQRHFKGYITAIDALEAAQRGEKSVIPFIKTDMPTVDISTIIQDVLPIISDSPTPVAVVEGEKLRGILIRGVIIEALASSTQEVQTHE